MRACRLLDCQRSKEHQAGIEPTSPRYEGGILPLDDQCLSVAAPTFDLDLNGRSNQRLDVGHPR